MLRPNRRDFSFSIQKLSKQQLEHQSEKMANATSTSALFYPNITTSTTSRCFVPPTIGTVSSETIQQFIMLLYFFTSLLSIVGNLIVIIVQLYGRESSRNIRKYLSNLAIADIMTAVLSMPFTYSNIVLGHWPHKHWLCPVAQYAQLLSVFVTATTLTIIGIERYIVTLHPLSPCTAWLQSHNRSLLISFWIIGALYAYIPVANTYANQFTWRNVTYYQCIYDSTKGNALKLRFFIIANFILTYFIPLLIMAASYAAIMHKLKNNRNFVAKYLSPNSNRCTWVYKERERDYSSNATRKLQHCISIDSRSKTIKMMLTIIILYIICWSPIKLFQFLQHNGLIGYCTRRQFNLMIFCYIASHWCAMANSMINPIIYSFLSKSFRNDCRKILNTLKGAFSCFTLKGVFLPKESPKVNVIQQLPN